MGASLGLVLPHQPDAVLQVQRVKVDLSWDPLESELLRALPFWSIVHSFNDLSLCLGPFTQGVAGADFNTRRLTVVDLLKHEEVFLARLQHALCLLKIVLLSLNPVVFLLEDQLDLQGLSGKSCSVGWAVLQKHSAAVGCFQNAHNTVGSLNLTRVAALFRLGAQLLLAERSGFELA